MQVDNLSRANSDTPLPPHISKLFLIVFIRQRWKLGKGYQNSPFINCRPNMHAYLTEQYSTAKPRGWETPLCQRAGFVTLVWNLTNTFGLHVSYDGGWTFFNECKLIRRRKPDVLDWLSWMRHGRYIATDVTKNCPYINLFLTYQIDSVQR